MNRIISSLKKNQTKAAIFSFSIVFICCKSAQYLAPSNADVTVAKSHWSGATLDQLNQGYSIYSDKCTECHGMKKPEDFSVEDWNKIMPSMGKKARLDSNQYNLVYHYILAKRETVLASKK